MMPCIPIFNHIMRYNDKSNNCIAAKILPGEFYVTQHDEMITTVLGSCVSACIYDSTTGFGGMNHFMLAEDGCSNNDDSARYGLFAMESLINEVLKCGAKKVNLKAKLFGGGKMLKNMSDIGRNNIKFAQEFLFLEGIPLGRSDLGLIYPRKVNFFPKTGKVMVKRLKILHNTSVEQSELRYRDFLTTKPTMGEVELF